MRKEIAIILITFSIEGIVFLVGVNQGFTLVIQGLLITVIIVGVLLLYILNRKSSIYWGRFKDHFKGNDD
ncbi:hypothetical protein [Anaerorhabdus sp.]|jgi:hypothetical protein|uniref:hypothetical protein n=1 Tax=Anaerorhabdus sp. TaxID=1872524 RepID=UPI002FCA6F5A